MAGNTGGRTNQPGEPMLSEHAPVVLLTRPEAQSREIASILPQDAEVVVSPIIQIEPLPFSVDVAAYELLVFASRNAVRIASQTLDLEGRKAVTVGKKTAAEAEKVGLQAVCANGAAPELISTVIAQKPTGSVLFLHGQHTRGNVAKSLISVGIDTVSATIYAQKQLALTQAARDLFMSGRPIILPLYSPRSAQLLSEQVAKLDVGGEIDLIAISKNALDAWDGPTPSSAIVAADQTAAAMRKEILAQIVTRS